MSTSVQQGFLLENWASKFNCFGYPIQLLRPTILPLPAELAEFAGYDRTANEQHLIQSTLSSADL